MYYFSRLDQSSHRWSEILYEAIEVLSIVMSVIPFPLLKPHQGTVTHFEVGS